MSAAELPRIPLVIDRSRWLRGEGEFDSWLMRSRDGKMCCLGFACLAMGLSVDQIIDTAAPDDHRDDERVQARMLYGAEGPGADMTNAGQGRTTHNNAVRAAIRFNDRTDMLEVERELRIVEALGKLGFDVTFIDAPPGTAVEP